MNVSTQTPTARAWAEIDLAALRANARTVQAAAGGAPLLPMVKADAYGLGALACARALEVSDPWGFGVATVAEGIALRAGGITRPVLVFTPARAEQLPVYRRYDLRAVLDDPAVSAAWDLPFHLEIDTGMARCGLRWDDRTSLARVDARGLEGAFTHFAVADTDPQSVDRQAERFRRALEALPVRPAHLHLSGSAGAWRYHGAQTLVRPGIYLYGGTAAADLPPAAPVLTLRAPIVSVRTLPKGEAVSYGAEWVAPRATRIATLGIGYTDGIARAAGGRLEVLIHGRRYPVVGRITMDFVMVDLGSPTAPVRVGDVATLVGRDDRGEITLDECAGWCGTIGYELLARLGARVERRYGES